MLREDWIDEKVISHYNNLVYILEIEVISRPHNNSLANYFKIKKTKELITRKYFKLSLRKNVYIKDCDICLASKIA